MTSFSAQNIITAFASTAPGLEPVVRHELSLWSIEGTLTNGGVDFQCPFSEFITLAQMLRSPSRLLLRLNHGPLKKLTDLHALLNASPLAQLLPRGSMTELHVSTQNSLLRSDILKSKAKRMLKAILKSRPQEQLPQQIFLRVNGDSADLSIDPIGELRHKRGWRLEQGKAPLRENWAASLLFMAGWMPDEPLIDPFCGSGTIPIEAALMAARRSPFVQTKFPFHSWSIPSKTAPHPIAPVTPAFIQGSDHHAPSLEWAQNNARRAGVSCDWKPCAISELTSHQQQGLIISNPPYGKRLGQDVRNCYRLMGQRLRTELPTWRAIFLSPTEKLARMVDARVACLCTFKNGGQRVGVWTLEPAE